MPDESQQHHFEIDARRTKPRRRASDSDSAEDSEFAQFTLLADPTTISGGPSTPRGEHRDKEVEWLRSALHARAREIAALSHEKTTTTAENPEVHGPLLNSAEARQLADDARAREQASRAALALAHETRCSEAPATQPSNPQGEKTNRGWQQRSLVRSPPESEAPPTSIEELQTTEPATGSTIASLDTLPPDGRPIERAEIRELRATLAIARDTAIGQKDEIARLRNQLAEQNLLLERNPRENQQPESETPELLQLLDEAESERSRLYERLRLNQHEAEARDAERILLSQTLAERETEIAERTAQLDDLRGRFDAQDQALSNARLQFERERSQNTGTQALLGRLRQTLESHHESESSLVQDPAAQPGPGMEPTPIAIPIDDSTLGPSEPVDESNLREGLAHGRSDTTEPMIHARPAIFDAWQDDQIRRHFGPMGIDTIVDLLRAPLARRVPTGQSEQKIVLLGRGAWSWAPTLAEGLVQNGTGPFTLHIADPEGDGMHAVRGIPSDSPLRDFLRPLRFPETPEALADSLSRLNPAALISRDFLSMVDEVTPWLDALSEFAERGPCLLFSERTGIGPVDVPDEISAIGDRIWALLPNRYTRVVNTQERLQSWREAFAKSQTGRANDLLSALRGRFQLEMLVQFGFLAEPFLTSPIGSNFNARTARDLKFLSQLADLDDRKIEAGSVPALHLVAIVDSESEC